MQTYRLYFADQDGRFGLTEDIEAGTDEVAVDIATSRVQERTFELWQGHRLVMRMNEAVPG